MPSLGPISSLNRRLHAIRILPFVHADAIVVVLLGIIAAVAGGETWDTLRSTTEPEPTSLAAILGPKRVRNPHVEVTGMVFPRTSLKAAIRANHGGPPPRFAYVSMLHQSTKRILLVRFPREEAYRDPREVIVRGMLQTPDFQVARKLDASRWTIAGRPVERRYVLIAGLGPKPLWLFATVAGLSTALALGMVADMLLSKIRPRAEYPTP